MLKQSTCYQKTKKSKRSWFSELISSSYSNCNKKLLRFSYNVLLKFNNSAQIKIVLLEKVLLIVDDANQTFKFLNLIKWVN